MAGVAVAPLAPYPLVSNIHTIPPLDPFDEMAGDAPGKPKVLCDCEVGTSGQRGVGHRKSLQPIPADRRVNRILRRALYRRQKAGVP